MLSSIRLHRGMAMDSAEVALQKQRDKKVQTSA
jgi:hypothetical protein